MSRREGEREMCARATHPLCMPPGHQEGLVSLSVGWKDDVGLFS